MRKRCPPVRFVLFAVLAIAFTSGCGESNPVDANDDEPGTLEIVGDSEPEGVVEGEAELAVRVRTPDGTPVQRARVFWEVEEGEAELSEGNPTLSGADGVSRQTVELGEIPGIVVVRAILDPTTADPAVIFRIQVRGS